MKLRPQVLGSRSALLATMAKVIISCQYIATFACVLALFSFIFYLTAFFKRLDDFVDRDDSNSVTIAVIQVPLPSRFHAGVMVLVDELCTIVRSTCAASC